MRPYLLFLFIICAHTAAADSISVAAARRTAARLLVGTNNGNKLWSRDLRNTGKDLQMRERTVSTYIFSNADGAFAAVAADDRLPPVLAYGNCGNKDMPRVSYLLIPVWRSNLCVPLSIIRPTLITAIALIIKMLTEH